MKYLFTLLALAMLIIPAHAQDDISAQLNDLLAKKEFQRIIEEHADKAKDYPASAIYNIGMSYYMTADDTNCLKYMDMAIAKEAGEPSSHYIKGMTYNYMEQFENAVSNFNKAIALDDSKAKYHSGLGDAYFSLNKLKEALKAYHNAVELDDAPDRPFTMIPQIYNELKLTDQALTAFYVAKGRISKEASFYTSVVYNIGLAELLARNYDKAELAFRELIDIAPADYQSYAKLIQVHYGRKEFEKAEAYKEILYEAHGKGVLKGKLKNEYCFDQFKWNDKLIQVFERFAEPEGGLHYKHLFYVVNKNDQVDFTIQTECSAIWMEQGGPKYILGMTKGQVHSTFDIGFDEGFKYEILKETVIQALEGKLSPSASSLPSKL
ncbi:MAG: tetratricopeptide repeat protein [Flavobacteriales bacterium]|nr:tetratricopeptide repeat protein [Flavobacteriales bacterium]